MAPTHRRNLGSTLAAAGGTVLVLATTAAALVATFHAGAAHKLEGSAVAASAPGHPSGLMPEVMVRAGRPPELMPEVIVRPQEPVVVGIGRAGAPAPSIN